MNKKEKTEIRSIELQWAFVIIATIAAFLIGIAVNALYEVLRERFSASGIFMFFGLLGFVFLHFLTYMIENLENLRRGQDKTLLTLMKEYVASNYQSLKKMFKKRFSGATIQ